MRKILALLALFGIAPMLMAVSGGLPTSVPNYIVTPAEVAAGANPTRLGFAISNILRYGGDPTGVADSTTAATNCHKLGTVCYYPTGTYKISSGIPIPCGGIVGDGPALSIISSTAAGTANLFNYTCAVGGVFNNYQVTGPSMTGGWALTVTAASGENTYTQISNVFFNTVWSGVSFIAASHFTVSNINVVNFSGDGVTVNNTNNADSGDSAITNSNFWDPSGPSLTANGIHHIASGGLKTTANKFNGLNVCYNLDLGTTGTSVLTYTGNSCENIHTEGFLIQRTSGVAKYNHISIVGNEFMANTGLCIVSNPASNITTNMVIANNTFQITGGTNSCLLLQFVTNLTIVGNTLNSTAGAGTTGINIQGITNVNMAANSIAGFTTNYFPASAQFTANDLNCTTACNVTGMGIGQSAFIVKGGITTRQSVIVPANDPDLQYTNVPAGTYQFSVDVNYGCANTTLGMNWNVNYSGTTTAGWYSGNTVQNNTTAGVVTLTEAAAATTVQQTVVAAGCGLLPTNALMLEGLITVSTTGTLAFSWSQATSTALNLSIGIPSYMNLLRVF
jgi:hypothetical protein